MIRKGLCMFFVLCAAYMCTSPSYAIDRNECIIDQKGAFFLDQLLTAKRTYRLEVYNNTGQEIDLFVNGRKSVTLAAGESMTYKIRLYPGYYMCLTISARMNGYYSRVYDFTVGRYNNDDCLRPITFARYDFPSEATPQRVQEGFVVTVVNASTNAFEVFRDAVSLGIIQPGELKAFQTTLCTFVFRSSPAKFISRDVRSQSVLIIKDSDFP